MKQITFTPRNHQLTNINTWTPDSQWLVYDVRPSGASFTGETIERVNVQDGEVDVIEFQIVTMGSKVSEKTAEMFAANSYRDYAELHGLF